MKSSLNVIATYMTSFTGLAVIAVGTTFSDLWVRIMHVIAGSVLIVVGLVAAFYHPKCPSCGFRTKHDPGCRERLWP